MKRFLSLLCSITLALSLTCVPAFAAEVDTVPESKTVVADFDNSISPAAESKGLWYEENLWFIDIHSFNVTPESGANLNVWLKNDNPVVLTVYKTNMFGGYSKVYGPTKFDAGERDVRVATNCNGKKFLVKYQSALDGSVMSTLVYQN